MLDQTRIRLDAIVHLLRLRHRWIAVPGSELHQFESQGHCIYLRGPQGIFKPRELDEPLTILSSLASSYRDEPLEGDRVRYGFLPPSREFDNDGLKRAAEFRLPLIYFLQVNGEPAPEYEVFAPVYVVGWNDDSREFLIDLSGEKPDDVALGDLPPPRRALQLPLVAPELEGLDVIRDSAAADVDSSALRRIRRAHFRREVLKAHRDRCAVCGLRVRGLLDALDLGGPDAKGKPGNGIALCGTHLRAFATGIMTIGENRELEVHLPPAMRRGKGEIAMLLAFEGKKVKGTVTDDR